MLVIRGKVDEWRRERVQTYLIHASLVENKNRVNMLEAMPLPFDDELKEEGWTEDEVERTMREYNEAVSIWKDHDPFKK